MRLQESGEMYIETIYLLGKSDPKVRCIDVANKMEVSKPSVSRAISLLKEAGYVTTDGKGYLSLTANGLDVAQKMYERHVTISAFLQNLGVSKATADIDACRIEHIISEESFAAIKNHK